MNTLNFLDANVWLALIWSQHVHSEKARSWFEQASVDRTSDEQFFFCRFTQITVLRLLTTSQVMGKNAKTMSEAWSLWDKIWADPRIAFLSEPSDLEKEFRSRSVCPLPHPKSGRIPTSWPSPPPQA